MMDGHLGFKGVVQCPRYVLSSLGKEIIEEAHEDAGVIRSQLAHVEVPQRPQQHLSSARPLSEKISQKHLTCRVFANNC